MLVQLTGATLAVLALIDQSQERVDLASVAAITDDAKGVAS
jgi:hypothetical protein